MSYHTAAAKDQALEFDAPQNRQQEAQRLKTHAWARGVDLFALVCERTCRCEKASQLLERYSAREEAEANNGEDNNEHQF